ncbi:prephenate dehydrogenase, partial [Candidatus Bathyarchaeota archaeon]|nr:prephenate dehydrogenase [Candidatus Bathyarchaeota archaeon]
IASEDENFAASLQVNLPEADKVEELFVKKAMEWLNIVKQKNAHIFADKMRRLKSMLKEVDPQYDKAYDDMYKMLETLKNGN